jgi:hypothetical protein
MSLRQTKLKHLSATCPNHGNAAAYLGIGRRATHTDESRLSDQLQPGAVKMALRRFRAEHATRAPKHVHFSWSRRLIELSKIQHTAMPQYAPHFFEESQFVAWRQRMQRKRTYHFVECYSTTVDAMLVSLQKFEIAQAFEFGLFRPLRPQGEKADCGIRSRKSRTCLAALNAHLQDALT